MSLELGNVFSSFMFTTGVIGSNVLGLDFRSSNAITFVITVTE